MIKVGILGVARRQGTFAEVGLRSWEEAGGAAVERALYEAGEGVYTVHRPLVIHSNQAELIRILRDWCDAPNPDSRCDLILTVGGVGLEPAEVMPEAATAVIERAAPGIVEAMRQAMLSQGALAAASLRAVSGIRGRTLIITLPGASEEIDLAMASLAPLLPSLVQAVQSGS